MTVKREGGLSVLDLVERKYCGPHWAFVREFRNDTGFNATRFADALAVGLYASRGQLIVGFEAKVSRADWLRELKAPDKAEEIAQYCDRWNVVVPDDGIVDLAELPPNWGLLISSGRRLRIVKAAPQLTPKALPRDFLAAIVKQAIDAAVAPYTTSDDQKVKEAEAEGFKRGELCAARALERANELTTAVQEFEKASGVSIHKWNAGNIGNAVKAVMGSGNTIKQKHTEVCHTIASTETFLGHLRTFYASLEPALEQTCKAVGSE